MSTKVKKIDWLNHFLEFAVVLIGIVIAFQLNMCSAKKAEQEKVAIHVEQIKKETEFNQYALKNSIKYTALNSLKLDTVINLIRLNQNFEKIDQLSVELLNYGGIYLRRNAYLTLTETGDLRFMNNFDQKQKIINLYEYYKWIESYDDMSEVVFTGDFYPYLRDNFDLSENSIQKEEIYTSKKYRNILIALQRTNANKLEKFKDCLKEINKYLED